MNSPLPVLVAYAEDAAGSAAFRSAAREARLRDTSLTVIHQLVGTEAPDRYGRQENLDHHRQAAMYELLRKAHDAAPGIGHVDVKVTTGDIGHDLVLASAESALLVLGMTTRHAIEAAAFHTVPHQLVRQAHCPVLLVPADAQEWQGAPVIIGVNRSRASASALRWAAVEASRRGVTMRAVEILPKPSPVDADDSASLQTWVRDHLEGSATTVLCSTEPGHAAHRLLEIAGEAHALLVIGAHERTRWLKASVARVVTSQSHVPVVVVPASDWSRGERPRRPGLSALADPAARVDSPTMTKSSPRTDDELQQAVEEALRSPLGTQAPHVGVAADNGCITLTGHVQTDLQRRAARAAASYVSGVELVENDIVAVDRLSNAAADRQVAEAATKAIQTSPDVPYGTVSLTVRDHVVTLTGLVHSPDARVAAERAVFAVPGVQGIRNRITTQRPSTDTEPEPVTGARRVT